VFQIASDYILDGVKKALGLAAEYDVFDPEIIMHINSTFSTLHQLGVGPADGFTIEDNVADWADFIGTDARLSSVKSYVYLKVKLLFDPPPNSFAITSLKEMAQEYEWRLNVYAENREVSS
jgi:hypothetical protein